MICLREVRSPVSHWAWTGGHILLGLFDKHQSSKSSSFSFKNWCLIFKWYIDIKNCTNLLSRTWKVLLVNPYSRPTRFSRMNLNVGFQFSIFKDLSGEIEHKTLQHILSRQLDAEVRYWYNQPTLRRDHNGDQELGTYQKISNAMHNEQRGSEICRGWSCITAGAACCHRNSNHYNNSVVW